MTVNVACPCSIWGAGVTPATPDSGDASSTELGVKFTSEVFGTVTGIRFYKSAANTGTHIGSLWTASGTLLASATFTGETASGWQQVNFSSPSRSSPNTTYVVAYLAPKGHYSADIDYFYTPPPTGRQRAQQPAPARARPAATRRTNGLYSYSSTSTFPTSTYNGTNYWVDVALLAGAGSRAGDGRERNRRRRLGDASPGPRRPAAAPVTTYTITPYIGSTAQTPTTVIGSPPATTRRSPGSRRARPTPSRCRPPTPTAPARCRRPPTRSRRQRLPRRRAPTSVSASPATEQALVSWTAPSSERRQPDHRLHRDPVRRLDGADPGAASSASATSTTITGLTNGTSYTFTVTATNAIGTSQASSARTPSRRRTRSSTSRRPP